MKKGMPLIILLAMAGMLMISWSNVSNAKTQDTQKYQVLMEQAKRYEDKKIYVDAVKKYKQALELQPDYTLAMKVAELYKSLGSEKNYVNALNNAIQYDSTNPEPYLLIARTQKLNNEKNKLFQILKKAERGLTDESRVTDEQRKEMDSMMKELLSEFRVYSFRFDEFYGFHRLNGKGSSYAKVRNAESFGLIGADCNAVRACKYEDINLPSASVYPIKEKGEYYYTDKDGYRKIVTNEPASAIGVFDYGYAPVQINGKYGYIDKNMMEYHFEYEYAGAFENGIAPVKKDGKWMMINTQFAPISEARYDEILMDCYGLAAPYGVFFAKNGASWSMYNAAGALLAEGFEEVEQFASKQPAAVKKDGKWGFVNLSGKMVIEPQYLGAHSFAFDRAPVLVDNPNPPEKQPEKTDKKDSKDNKNKKTADSKKTEKDKKDTKQDAAPEEEEPQEPAQIWGVINRQQEMLIEPQFWDMQSFNEQGYAYAVIDGEKHFIAVTEYKEDKES